MLQFSKAQAGEKKAYPKLDKPGRYIAEVVKVEQIKSKEHPDWKPGTRFLFRVLEAPFIGSFASGIVTSFWKLGNPLDVWFSALGINGAELDENMSDDLFKKRRVVIGVEINPQGYANVKALYAPRAEDEARIAPEAVRNNYTPKTQLPAGGTTTPAPASVQQAPVQRPPVQAPGVVTKDDSLPF
jgi:hypothetical protein